MDALGSFLRGTLQSSEADRYDNKLKTLATDAMHISFMLPGVSSVTGTTFALLGLIHLVMGAVSDFISWVKNEDNEREPEKNHLGLRSIVLGLTATVPIYGNLAVALLYVCFQKDREDDILCDILCGIKINRK